MPNGVIVDKYFIVHAGVDPEKSIEEQDIEDLLWIREDFIDKPLKQIEKRVVFGHTPTESGRITCYSNDSIGIDCNSIYSNRLGVLELKTSKSIYIR